MKGEKKYCEGCRNNFYNGNNALGINECWYFSKSKTVKRWRIGWWTPMDKKENFTKVMTNSCHTAPGQFAYCEELPEHLREKK